MLARILMVLMVLAALAAGLGYLKYRQIREQIAFFSQPQPAPTVEVIEVRLARWEPVLRGIGSVQAVQWVEVSSEVEGQVREILFESGERVEAGAPLLRLDDSIDRADLDGLLAAERLAGIQLERTRQLLRDRAVAQGDFDAASAQLDQARALVAAKQAGIAKKTIRAPFSGELGIRQVNPGQFLSAGDPIVTLQSLNPIYVDYSLPERHLSQVSPGQSVRIEVAAYPGRRFEGHIEALSPDIDLGTRALHIRARFDNSDLALRPGMFAQVETLLPAQEQVLTLPREAITFNTYGDAVYLIEEREGKLLAQRRQIRTGATRGEEIQVLDGLKAGDRVVRAGQVKLINGQEVRILNDAESAP